MKEFFRKQRYKFQQFMVGRYGVDKLYRALLIFFFVFIPFSIAPKIGDSISGSLLGPASIVSMMLDRDSSFINPLALTSNSSCPLLLPSSNMSTYSPLELCVNPKRAWASEFLR